jgi:hypothetical protein
LRGQLEIKHFLCRKLSKLLGKHGVQDVPVFLQEVDEDGDVEMF